MSEKNKAIVPLEPTPEMIAAGATEVRAAPDGGREEAMRKAERIVERVLRDVCELPDRNSPEDAPEMMLITPDELDMILRRHLGLEDAALTPAPDVDAGGASGGEGG